MVAGSLQPLLCCVECILVRVLEHKSLTDGFKTQCLLCSTITTTASVPLQANGGNANANAVANASAGVRQGICHAWMHDMWHKVNPQGTNVDPPGMSIFHRAMAASEDVLSLKARPPTGKGPTTTSETTYLGLSGSHPC